MSTENKAAVLVKAVVAGLVEGEGDITASVLTVGAESVELKMPGITQNIAVVGGVKGTALEGVSSGATVTISRETGEVLSFSNPAPAPARGGRSGSSTQGPKESF